MRKLLILICAVLLTAGIASAAQPDVCDALGPQALEHQGRAGLGVLDWIVLCGYFGSMLLIGWYYSRMTQTTEDYLLGGRDMKSWMVGLSLFATLLSTASYMSYPGEIIKHGPMIAASLLASPLVIWVVGWFLIPAFMKLRITSAYELLEMRLGLSVRLLGSAFFLFLRIGWMALIIYITSKSVLGPVLGIDEKYLPWLCAALGLITVMYTSSGGLKAVVLTDVIQTFVLFMGAFLAIGLITARLHGFGWFPVDWAPTWDPPVIWFDPNARITFASAITMWFFWYICTAGSDQMAVQRYLSTKNLKAARSAFTTSIVTSILVVVLLLLLGFALLGYYRANPQDLAVGMDIHANADQIFPHFIVSGLPGGITGLITAALLAAAMSSLSSGLNSACTIIMVDFFDRFSPKQWDEKQHVRRARLISWSLGLVIVAMSLMVDGVKGNFIEIVNKIGNLLVAPLFLLFFMAMFVPWANAAGTWIGAAVAVAVAVGIAFFSLFGLSFVWIIPLSLMSGIITGVAASLLFGGRRKLKE